MKALRLLAVTTGIGVLLALVIYWREGPVREQVSLVGVLLWQVAIWGFWTPGCLLLEQGVNSTRHLRSKWVWLAGGGLLLVALHFGWFFLLSSYFSPYLGLPNSRYGVYPYFFIFWTLMDLGLVGFVLDKLHRGQSEKPPVLLELTRGGHTFFCEPAEVYWLAAENYYTRVMTAQGAFLVRKPLKTFLDILPADRFLKIHRSTIINTRYVSELARGPNHSLEVVLKDGSRRKVSRNFIKDITLYFKNRST